MDFFFCFVCNLFKCDCKVVRLFFDLGGVEFLLGFFVGIWLVDGCWSVFLICVLGKLMVVVGGLEEFLVVLVVEWGVGRVWDIGRVDWWVLVEVGVERVFDLRWFVLVVDDWVLIIEGFDESFKVLEVVLVSVEVVGWFNWLVVDVVLLLNVCESCVLVVVEVGVLVVVDFVVGLVLGSGRLVGLDDVVIDVLGIWVLVVESFFVVCDWVMVWGVVMFGCEFGVWEIVVVVDILLDIELDWFLILVLEEGIMFVLGMCVVRVVCGLWFMIWVV